MVPGSRLLTFCVKGVVLAPAAMLVPPLDGQRVPKESLQVPGLAVPMRKYAVVAERFGCAVPFSVTVVACRLVSAPSVTVGTFGVWNV